jgi:chromosome partitioning protein
MKTLLIAAVKGGTGKTALLCQFAYYLRKVRRLRVLVIDATRPPCSTALLARACRAVVLSGHPLTGPDVERRSDSNEPGIWVLPSVAVPSLTLGLGDDSARYYANVRHLLCIVNVYADICLIDTAPLPDLRAVWIESMVDAMLSPIHFSHEALQNADKLINGSLGVRNIRARFDPRLQFVGLLPNMVEATPLQQANARALEAQFRTWLIPDPIEHGGYVCIPRFPAIAAAQAAGVSVADLGKTHSVRKAWRSMQGCVNAIAEHLDLDDLSSGKPGRNGAEAGAGAAMCRTWVAACACFAQYRWLIVLAVAVITPVFAPMLARADDWGCWVILCLTNPGGPEHYSACVPPIGKLWSAQRHGDPFSICGFGAGGSQRTDAFNTFASGGFCREDLLYCGGPEQSELLCRATGAINVDIDNQLYTCVWRDISGQGGTIAEFYGAGGTQVPYDPSPPAALFLQQIEQQNSFCGGGG